MVQIAGKYKLEKNEHLDTYLIALGLQEELAAKAISVTPTVSITVEGDKYTFDTEGGFSSAPMIFTLGQEFNDLMPTGHTFKSVPILTGNKLTITSTMGEKAGSRVYEFTDAGMTITMKIKGVPVEAVRTYKRL